MDVDESPTPGPDDHLRASDADRQQVADRLRKALDEGRLTLMEYDEPGLAGAVIMNGSWAATSPGGTGRVRNRSRPGLRARC